MPAKTSLSARFNIEKQELFYLCLLVRDRGGSVVILDVGHGGNALDTRVFLENDAWWLYFESRDRGNATSQFSLTAVKAQSLDPVTRHRIDARVMGS